MDGRAEAKQKTAGVLHVAVVWRQLQLYVCCLQVVDPVSCCASAVWQAVCMQLVYPQSGGEQMLTTQGSRKVELVLVRR
jgi:hypothetical protein